MLIATLALLSLWLVGRGALRREGRTESSIVRTILAPFGRIVSLPAGTELMAGKKYVFDPSQLYEPARVWVGWWNCRSFAADTARYYFFDRGSRYAIRVDAIPPGTEVTMQMILSSMVAALGVLASVAAARVHRRTRADRLSGRRPNRLTERRAARLLLSGMILLAAGLAGLLAL